jgi:UDP-N-acetylglucosamine/UDP-N-acetylgalactosamine 4-epimerase
LRVLVTGGAGFIGCNLVRGLLAEGHQVRILDNFFSGRRENLVEIQDDVELVEGRVDDLETARQAVAGVEVVFHEAAVPSVARSLRDPIASNQANVAGTVTMLTAARDAGVRRLVYAGSSSAYGNTPELPKVETMPPNPRSPYAISKLSGELYCRIFAQLFPIETVALRYFNVFGPRQDPDSPYAAVIPRFIRLLAAGEEIPVEGDGTQSRDFTYISNVVQANLKAMDAPGVSGEMMNVACGERFTLNEMIAALAQILNVTPRVRSLPPRPGDVPHSLADISKARRLLGYQPTVTFPEGLRKTADWLLSGSGAGS